MAQPGLIDAQRALSGALALVFSVIASAASAQPAPDVAKPATIDVLKQRDQELEAARAEQRKAAETERKLKSEIDALGEDRRKLNQALIETASRVQASEGRLSAAETRLLELESQERSIRKSLDKRRDAIAEVLAALQRIGRRPPPAILVTPEDALQSVRTAIMLGAVLPEMRNEAQSLAADLSDLVRVRRDAADERAAVTRDLASLGDERKRMALLIDERQKKQSETEKALAAEHQRATALARQVDTLKDLIARLEQGLDSATRAAREAARAPEDRKDAARTDVAKDPGRMTPAIAFASAKGLLPQPVNGVKLRDFGAADGFGGIEKGVSIATRAGAQVTAPCDGWVVFAGPFRSYGQLLILNAGGGYHVLLAGMERISVDLGQFVLTGEPVAAMGGGSQVATTLAIGSSQPVLYVEFRKDGTPVDPSPWWAVSEGEKVRG